MPDRIAATGVPPAFVDMDGTLLDCSSERLFLEALAGRGVISAGSTARFLAGYVLHPLETVRSGPGWNRLYLSGLRADDLKDLAENFARQSLVRRTRPQVSALVERLRKEGYSPVLLSASLEWLAGPVAEAAGMTDVIASALEERGGRLSGRVSGDRPWGCSKLRLALDLCARAGVPARSSAAAADSWSDRHLLAACGRAFAVHPGRRLAALARASGWEIVG
jgi:HAD superfamily phosphoserine phosphatase-like hydrolase